MISRRSFDATNECSVADGMNRVSTPEILRFMWAWCISDSKSDTARSPLTMTSAPTSRARSTATATPERVSVPDAGRVTILTAASEFAPPSVGSVKPELHPWHLDFYQDLHRHPELSVALPSARLAGELKRFGPDVNLGNIAPEEVIPLETLRLGRGTCRDFAVLIASVLLIGGFSKAFWSTVASAIPSELGWLNPLISGALYDREQSYFSTLWGLTAIMLLGAPNSNVARMVAR